MDMLLVLAFMQASIAHSLRMSLQALWLGRQGWASQCWTQASVTVLLSAAACIGDGLEFALKEPAVADRWVET